jgi:tRNA dimethylallyltransferase
VATSGIQRSEGEGPIRNAILIAGPTASGKSALALAFALRAGGTIVNADSMQAYDVLNVLTARPGPEELRQAPHLLYGHVYPGLAYSTGAWLRDVTALAAGDGFAGRRPIFVGGTGLYFRALVEGLPEMPDIPTSIRDGWRRELAERGAPALHEMLRRRDPEAASTLRPTDGQRVVRALEVLEASGRSILWWQQQAARPLVDPGSAQFLVVEPARPELARRIEQRFERMVENGAVEEVAALAALRLDPELPAMKAIGVRELQAAATGEISIEQAMARATTATRQYAKRQATWFRHQLGPQWRRIKVSGSTEELDFAGKFEA